MRAPRTQPGNGARPSRDDADTPDAERGRRAAAEVIGRVLGWGMHRISLPVPGAAQARSFHFELEAPPGLQIRRAALVVPAAGTDDEDDAQREPELWDIRRGARTLVRAHLQATGVPAGRQGLVVAQLKAEATKLLRGATFAAVVAVALLWWYYVHLNSIVERPGEEIASIAAILLLLPGLTTGLVLGGAEHPTTTYVLFHQRAAALLVALWPALAAVLLVTIPEASQLDDVWLVLLALATATLFALAGGWALARRTRPDGESP